jgi:hypothetical protein
MFDAELIKEMIDAELIKEMIDAELVCPRTTKIHCRVKVLRS